ncbi:MAG: hypothetical protein ABI321_03115 [Polyangia bacterium]
MKPHLLTQAALVRMLYDPSFAQSVRAQPRAVLPELPVALADELGRIDPRALRRDVHRRERTLGELCKELPCATTLAVMEAKSVRVLLDFYASEHFHAAITDGHALVLALGAYLEGVLAEGTLRSPHVAAVLAVELGSARARRDVARAAPGKLAREAGVEPLDVPSGTLATLRVVEQHRFRLALLPAWSVASDPPALLLPPLGALQPVCAVSIDGDVSLVEIERPLHAVLVSLPQPRTRNAVLDEATLRLGGDRAAAEAALDELLADELVAAFVG